MFLFVILTKTKAIIVLWTLFVLKVYTYTYRAHHHYNNNNNIISVMHFFCVIVPPSYNIIQQLLAQQLLLSQNYFNGNPAAHTRQNNTKAKVSTTFIT